MPFALQYARSQFVILATRTSHCEIPLTLYTTPLLIIARIVCAHSAPSQTAQWLSVHLHFPSSLEKQPAKLISTHANNNHQLQHNHRHLNFLDDNYFRSLLPPQLLPCFHNNRMLLRKNVSSQRQARQLNCPRGSRIAILQLERAILREVVIWSQFIILCFIKTSR